MLEGLEGIAGRGPVSDTGARCSQSAHVTRPHYILLRHEAMVVGLSSHGVLVISLFFLFFLSVTLMPSV